MKYIREPGRKNIVLINGVQIEIRERNVNGNMSYAFYSGNDYLGRSKGPLSLKKMEEIITRMHRVHMEIEDNRRVMKVLLNTGLSLGEIEYFAKSAHTSKLRREFEEATA